MLISEYLQLRGISSAESLDSASSGKRGNKTDTNSSGRSFAEELNEQISAQSKNAASAVTAEALSANSHVRFSKHAIERINEREIDLSSDRLERLNRGVSLAEEKGSDDAVIFVDSTAFLVSVKNNKVITTVSTDEMAENIFTNIDSAVIM